MATVLGSLGPPPSKEARARWQGEEGRYLRSQVLEALRSCNDGSGARTALPDLRDVQLSGEDLSGVDLSGCDLRGADLSHCDLTAAHIIGARLCRANFSAAKLDRAEFAGSDLRDARLDGCEAAQAGFGQCDLSGASFFRAHLDDASFIGARLHRTDFRATRMAGARLREADLDHADFTRADLRGVDLVEAKVGRARFVEADLRGARIRALTGFETASFLHADIRDVDFTNAYRLRRFIMDQSFIEEFRDQSPLHRMMYWLWWLTSDCGRSILRWSMCIMVTAGIFGLGYTFVDMDYGDYETPFSPYYFSVITLTTLGYGDVLPASLAGQVLSVCEVAVGYMLLGGLISIFANKMARRAE